MDKSLPVNAPFGKVSSNPSWDERWGCFLRGLLDRGVVSGNHDFFRNWVRKFIGFIKPRKRNQVLREDIEEYLELLVQAGKAGWQIAQASESPPTGSPTAIFSGFQLKIAQEVITLIVFVEFAVFYLKEKFAWNHLVAFIFLAGATFFAFAFKAPEPTA